MKKLIIGYLAFCTNHGQARCPSKTSPNATSIPTLESPISQGLYDIMDNKNDSSQVRDCLTHSDVPRGSGAGWSQDTTYSWSSSQRYSESSSTEATNSGQRPGGEALSGDTWSAVNLKREPACHMQLDKLSGSRNHTVLIDTNEFLVGKLVPYKGMHVWDNVHVKLPQCYPTHAMESRWAATERVLRRLMNGRASAGDVEAAIKTYNQAHKKDWRFDGLYSYAQGVSKLETNFSNVISKMAKLALKLPELIQHPIPLLRQNNNHAITMSQEQISCLLANAFFCTFPHRNTTQPNSEYGNFPTINFSSLFADRCPRKFQKLRALFHYFNTVTKEDTKPDGLVTFERICIRPSEYPDWPKHTATMTNLHVSSKGFIEREGTGMLQVDFAAKMIGGGVLKRGLVQEEIRFVQCPELIVARLFTEKLAENECLKITGVQMYNSTLGYSDSFEWHSPHTDHTPRDEWKRRYCQIVAIDALNFDDPRDQFTEKNIKRELLKAYVGFRKDNNIPIEYTPAIATGNWGCGAFKGDPMLKALIQMMAAAVAQRDLAYFTFGNKEQEENLKRMYQLIKGHQVTVGKLYNLLQDYCQYYRQQQQQQQQHRRQQHHQQHHKVKNVFDFIREKMGIHSSQL